MTRVRDLSAILAVAIALASAPGCARGRANADQDAAPAVDVELVAFLSEARALHHQANLKEDSNDLPGAIAAIQRLVTARRPHDGKPAPEIEEVLADAYARLAELQLRQGALDAAAASLREGLTHAPGPTYFRGHLVEIQGLVEEARAASLADAGQPEEAARARARAIELLEDVVRIQDQVIQRSLGPGREAPDARREDAR
jgi:tetratricopeptide (TPR) repeat protein